MDFLDDLIDKYEKKQEEGRLESQRSREKTLAEKAESERKIKDWFESQVVPVLKKYESKLAGKGYESEITPVIITEMPSNERRVEGYRLRVAHDKHLSAGPEAVNQIEFKVGNGDDIDISYSLRNSNVVPVASDSVLMRAFTVEMAEDWVQRFLRDSFKVE